MCVSATARSILPSLPPFFAPGEFACATQIEFPARAQACARAPGIPRARSRRPPHHRGGYVSTARPRKRRLLYLLSRRTCREWRKREISRLFARGFPFVSCCIDFARCGEKTFRRMGARVPLGLRAVCTLFAVLFLEAPLVGGRESVRCAGRDALAEGF